MNFLKILVKKNEFFKNFSEKNEFFKILVKKNEFFKNFSEK
jgi:hypothetical protein